MIDEVLFQQIYQNAENQRTNEQSLESVQNAILSVKNNPEERAQNPFVSTMDLLTPEQIKILARKLGNSTNKNTKKRAMESYLQVLDLQNDDKVKLKQLLESKGF